MYASWKAFESAVFKTSVWGVFFQWFAQSATVTPATSEHATHGEGNGLAGWIDFPERERKQSDQKHICLTTLEWDVQPPCIHKRTPRAHASTGL